MEKSILNTTINPLPAGMADLITPVTVYLKIRDRYPNAILLESSDYHGTRNSMSYICFDVISVFRVEDFKIQIVFPSGNKEHFAVTGKDSIPEIFNSYLRSFQVRVSPENATLPANGLFGYTTFDSVQYFDDIKFRKDKKSSYTIPDINYAVYRYIIGINHFNNRIFLIENRPEGALSGLAEVMSLLKNRSIGSFSFSPVGNEGRELSDEEYMAIVRKGREHCYLGDVFQIVLSRQFSQQFRGDEFNVYRALRNINPSPYLFYFDYGGFRLFGSSPEAQLIIEKGVARINPIAGTFRRSGDDEQDRLLAIDLANDKKENAEHVMLVDLARNDLSRNSDRVTLKTFREVQFYSHVIHLVSEVAGELREGYNPVRIFGDTFPAGTLSGAPKYRAMELIDELEKTKRGFYGGAIGYIGFNGDINHAITIRSFLSRNNTLYYQAGAGIVADSVETSELNEVRNKLGALKAAIATASEI